MQLNQEQRSAIQKSISNPISVICGNAGTGKSLTIEHLCKTIKENVLLCAPTGCAADLLTNSTGIEAHVVDKVLCSGRFKAMFPRCTIIIDECSMLSLKQLVQLLVMLKPKRIVLVGDDKQLPCTREESVFKYFIGGLFPLTRLTRIMRQQDGESALFNVVSNYGLDGFSVFEDTSFYTKSYPSKREAIDAMATEYTEHTQMLAFTNEICDTLNNLTKSMYTEVVRVICTSNHYVNGKLEVANGTKGLLVGDTVKYENKNRFMDVKDHRGEFRTSFVPARCITVDKAQGSQVQGRVSVLVDGPPMLITAQRVYTALTRSKTQCVIYGTTPSIQRILELKFPEVKETTLDPKLVALTRRCFPRDNTPKYVQSSTKRFVEATRVCNGYVDNKRHRTHTKEEE